MNLNKNLHKKTCLTEFARNFEEDKDTVLSKLVNKIYVACNSTATNESADLDATLNPDFSTIPSSSSDPSRESKEESISESEITAIEYQVDVSQGRTNLSVVKRISNLVAMKDKDLNDYKNTELQKLWMPDRYEFLLLRLLAWYQIIIYI